MTTRIFKKPILKRKENQLSDGDVQTPIPSRFLKKLEEPKKSKRTQYLEQLESDIFKKEKEREIVIADVAAMKKVLDEAFEKDRKDKEKILGELESQLVIKREERARLEAPILQRDSLQNERDARLNEREKELDGKEQNVLVRERDCESKLEGIKDLADELGETRLRLTIKEKLLSQKESVLSKREGEYILAVENLAKQEKKFIEAVQEREYALSLREMNLQGKEENLLHREKQLADGNIALNDKYNTLLRTEKRLERK